MLAQFNSNVIECLDSIKVPTLVLVGANDEAFLNATDYMANKIPGAQKVVIADAGHAANMHQPEAFNKAMAGFLDSLPKDQSPASRCPQCHAPLILRLSEGRGLRLVAGLAPPASWRLTAGELAAPPSRSSGASPLRLSHPVHPSA